MGLLDQLGQAAGGLFGGANADPLLQAVLGLLDKNSQLGGLEGLVQSFQRNGLQEVINSWVGTGQNLPISADQVKQGLGSDFVGQLASKAGLSPETAGNQLADLLPGLIDQLTPDGKVPDSGLLAQGLNLLKGKLG
jgi:uncharacterized protein YidB (DUF937 family)